MRESTKTRGNRTRWKEQQGVVLTHLFAKDPDLGGRVDLDEHRGRAHEQHHQVGHAQVHEEDVGRVAHVLALEDDDRHHDVADDADAEYDDAEDHGGGADVVGEDGPPGHRVGAAGQVEAGVVGGRRVVFGRRRQRRQHRVGHFVVRSHAAAGRTAHSHAVLFGTLARSLSLAVARSRDAVSTDDRVALTEEAPAGEQAARRAPAPRHTGRRTTRPRPFRLALRAADSSSQRVANFSRKKSCPCPVECVKGKS